MEWIDVGLLAFPAFLAGMTAATFRRRVFAVPLGALYPGIVAFAGYAIVWVAWAARERWTVIGELRPFLLGFMVLLALGIPLLLFGPLRRARDNVMVINGGRATADAAVAAALDRLQWPFRAHEMEFVLLDSKEPIRVVFPRGVTGEVVVDAIRDPVRRRALREAVATALREQTPTTRWGGLPWFVVGLLATAGGTWFFL